MQPKFITFVQCTFGKDEWNHAAGSEAGGMENMAMRNMVIFKPGVDSARINLLDMTMKEVRLLFEKGTFVGVGDGLLYFHADKVLDTKISDPPSEYYSPDPSRYSNG